MAALLGGVELEIKNPPVKPLPTVDLQLPASASLDLIAHRPDVALPERGLDLVARRQRVARRAQRQLAVAAVATDTPS